MTGRPATEFERELTKLLNSQNMENGSDTPDFLLSEYLVQCLVTWNWMTKKRDNWYGQQCGDGARLNGTDKGLQILADKNAINKPD